MKYSLQKRISAFVLAFALVMTTAFNSIGATTKADAAAKVKTLYLTKKTTSLVEGETGTAQWAVKATKATKALAAVKVTTSDPSVVKITKTTQSKKAGKTAKAAKKNKGTVKFEAVSAGTATIKIVTKKKTKKTKSFKVTVTAKSTEAPATSETPATTAPASADATTGVVATTEVPASSNPLKAVSLSTKTPKVGDVITVVTDPVNASNIKSYKWFADAKEISGEASASYTVKKEDLGKVIKVVVTDLDSVEFTSNESAAVIEDNTQSVTLSVPKGLQADNTALSTDNIELTYGSGLGKLQDITWYCNDKFIRMTNFNAGRIYPEDLIWDTAPGANGKVPSGIVYVVITNQEGKTFKSNTLEVVDKQLPAKISNVTIDENYSDAADIVLDKESTAFVISATLNKDYDGKFSILPAEAEAKTGVTGAVYAGAGVPSTVGLVTDSDKSVMNAKSYLSDYTVVGYYDGNTNSKYDAGEEYSGNDIESTKAYRITNADKSVTYMFALQNGSKLTRGSSYKLVFEQTEVENTKLTAEANKNAIVSETFVAPYVKQPEALAVTAVGETLTSIESKLLVSSADSTVAEYITSAANSFKAYSNEKYDTSSGKEMTLTTKSFTKGVAKQDTIVASPATKIAVYTTFECAGGVFGKEAFKLTSAYKIVPTVRAATVSVKESKSSANDIFVDLAGQRCSGEVFLYKRINDGSLVNAAYLTDLINTTNKDEKCGSVKVKLGDGGATFKDAIKTLDNTKTAVFAAKFVPDDASYATGKSDLATENDKGLEIECKATTFELTDCTIIPTDDGKKMAAASKKLTVKDQFGQAMTSSLPTELTTASKCDPTANSNSFVDPTDGSALNTMKLAIANDGTVSLSVASNTTSLKATDSWTYKTTYGTFTIKVTEGGKMTADQTGGAAASSNTAKFTISLSK